jgi:hypothetical protein
MGPIASHPRTGGYIGPCEKCLLTTIFLCNEARHGVDAIAPVVLIGEVRPDAPVWTQYDVMSLLITKDL